MNTKLTVVVDNIPSEEIKGEWGLSIFVEYGEKKILADAGASALFSQNMKKLGLNISEVEYATLSHAHYDHANGMAEFFRENSAAKFYLRESSAENCYKKVLCFPVYIGLPKKIMSDFSERIELVSGDYKLCEGVFLVPHKTPGLSSIGKREGMYKRYGLRFKPDDFSHEQSLVLDTDKGLVIINCCSHGGAVNIINEVSATFPDKHVHALIGGFHLFNKSEEEVREVARKIKETGIDFVCTGHCTGKRAFNVMKEELGDTISQLHVGLEMEF